MTRDIDASVVAASQDEVYRDVVLVRLAYDSGDVLVCSTPFDLDWDWDGDAADETFKGVGELGSYSQADEGTELRAYTRVLKLSGVPAANLALALGENYQGRDARIWYAFLDEDHQIIGTPVLEFRGRMDVQPIKLGDTREIALTLRSRLADWETESIRRFTNEDQQAEYPGDLGLEFVAQMKEKELIWGRG